MIPFILTALGGYLIGNSLKDNTFGSEFARGGVIGDSARVIAINKSGVIMDKMGKKYLLRFVDGTEGVYEQSELEFTHQ